MKSASELARQYDLHPSTIQRAARLGKIPSTKNEWGFYSFDEKDPFVLEWVSGLFPPREERKYPDPALTDRELEVLELLGSEEGLRDYDLAEKLQITVHTIRCHLRAIYPKIGARNRKGAIKYAHEYLGRF